MVTPHWFDRSYRLRVYIHRTGTKSVGDLTFLHSGILCDVQMVSLDHIWLGLGYMREAGCGEKAPHYNEWEQLIRISKYIAIRNMKYKLIFIKINLILASLYRNNDSIKQKRYMDKAPALFPAYVMVSIMACERSK